MVAARRASLSSDNSYYIKDGETKIPIHFSDKKVKVKTKIFLSTPNSSVLTQILIFQHTVVISTFCV